MTDETDHLLHRLVSGDEYAGTEILEWVWTRNSPPLLVAAALLAEQPNRLLDRAAKHARTTRDRQLVALAAARLDDDRDRLVALTQDHLADHPDSVLAGWIATTEGAAR